MNVPIIPYGGFLAIKSTGNQAELAVKLSANPNIQSLHLPDNGLFLAAWTQFSGQGLWQSETGAVAYDLDLTNTAELCTLVSLPIADVDQGELIFALYRKYGNNFCDKLRGAFAFAIWDGSSRVLLVVTDFYGIRPVVTTQRSGLFAAASRIRQLELVGINKEINPEAIYHYLFFQAVCSPVSIYKDVRKLEPGKCIVVTGDKVNEQTWYDIVYKPVNGRSKEQWCQQISSEVEKAVGNFVATKDEPETGCFLSGGTDSSSIAGYYTRLSPEPVKTFSIGFDDPKYNELDFARVAVNRFGSAQHEYLVTPKDVLQLITDLPKIYDEPFGNASVIAAYFCAKLARENNVAMMLGGDGGDEIFGGNERYVTNLVFQRYAELPEFFRKGLFEPLLGLLPSSGVFYKAKR
ncbi:asparagine synthase-related protein, partial [Deltaproteobacteria bacterium]|nr:asparagine synthase-related protein [Deltaproteobacteria bacterium]